MLIQEARHGAAKAENIGGNVYAQVASYGAGKAHLSIRRRLQVEVQRMGNSVGHNCRHPTE